MKLALVRQKYTAFGGAERFVERALSALSARGVDVEIIARQWDAPDPAGGRRWRQVNPFYIGRTWRDMGFASAVQRIIASHDYDLVQSHERIPGCHVYRAGDGVHATWLAQRNAARQGLARMGGLDAMLSPWHRHVLKAEADMFRHPDLRAVICNSRMVRDDIQRRFGVADEKLHVIYNGVDLAHFHRGLRAEHRETQRQKQGAPDGVKVALFVGSGYERKGLPVLLRAMARMKHHDLDLLVVGRDKHERIMKEFSRTLGLNGGDRDRVHFLGPQPDVRPFYGAADFFVLPTHYDPFPNAALEALACGLPVITTTACGAAELLAGAHGQSGAAGVAVPANDVVALSTALDDWLANMRDPAIESASREAAVGSVAGLTLDAMAQRLTSFYADIIRS